MDRWEYYITPFPVKYPVLLEHDLNHLGKEGWELVTTIKHHYTDTTQYGIFKRKVIKEDNGQKETTLKEEEKQG